MRNRMKWYRSRYIFLAITLFVTLIGVYHFNQEISDAVGERSASDMENSANVFSMYLNDFIEEHISSLEETAVLIADSALADVEQTKKILQNDQRDFAFYTILRETGEKEYDSDEISLNFNLVKSEFLDTIIKDKKTVIYSSTVQDDDRNKYIAVCTPVRSGSSVDAILVGLIRITEINDLLQHWEVTQDGCAFLMTMRGNYLTSGERFYDILAGEASDFLTYISECSIRDSSLKSNDLYKTMQQKKDISLRYTYEGERFISVLLPVSNCEWYIGYLTRERTFYINSYKFSTKTSFFLWLAGILWGGILVYTVLLVYRYGKEKEQLERYRTISRLNKSILIEMQFSPKKLQLFGNVKEFFNIETDTFLGEEVYEVYNLVHPEDVSVRKRLHQFFEDTAEIFSAEVRIEVAADKYGWFRIMGTLIKDPRTGNNVKFIAKIECADEEIADEKNLVERAENDLLTGVLNKKTMEERVIASLANIPSSSYRIFFMVDLDNFKNVNDKLGHIMGDKAIVDTANRLSEIFHRDAYVGRLGGDEFAVCASYVAFDEESLYKFIMKKADKICEVNRRTYANGDTAISISSSVGIAIAPDMATNFEDLYKKADSALYKSKNGGKNCYHIYGRD